jgi:hypothetical protein
MFALPLCGLALILLRSFSSLTPMITGRASIHWWVWFWIRDTIWRIGQWVWSIWAIWIRRIVFSSFFAYNHRMLKKNWLPSPLELPSAVLSFFLFFLQKVVMRKISRKNIQIFAVVHCIRLFIPFSPFSRYWEFVLETSSVYNFHLTRISSLTTNCFNLFKSYSTDHLPKDHMFATNITIWNWQP